MPSQNLEQVQKIGIRLSQQQLRFVRMLELNTPELEEVVERELEDNPALGVKEETTEEDTRRYPTYTAPPRNDYAFTPEDRSETLYDQLLAQLSERRLSPRVETAARFIIGSLDSNGYLNYLAACYFAQTGDNDRALQAAEKSLKAGYANLYNWTEYSDGRVNNAPLRDDLRFLNLLHRNKSLFSKE